MRHDCTTAGDWSHCVVCDGRIHLDACTSKRNKHRDCCAARHQMLFEQGHTRGLADDSFEMWAPEHPCGYHAPERREKDGLK